MPLAVSMHIALEAKVGPCLRSSTQPSMPLQIVMTTKYTVIISVLLH
jgi:hypothetical protein